jgi:hypothetical protein
MTLCELTAQARAKPPLVANIPAELKAKDQWVDWRYEERKGKQTKVPVSPATGYYASSTEPADWASFSAALWPGSDQGITVLSEYRLALASQGAIAKRAHQRISRPLRDQAQGRRGHVIGMQRSVTHAHDYGVALLSAPTFLTQLERRPENACQTSGSAVTAVSAIAAPPGADLQVAGASQPAANPPTQPDSRGGAA